jgi:hypothetical protein
MQKNINNCYVNIIFSQTCFQGYSEAIISEKHDHNFQELWNMIKEPNLTIHEYKKELSYKLKIENLFNKIIAENSPNLGKHTDLQVQEAF